MRILHIGSPMVVLECLASEERARGLTSRVVGSPSGQDIGPFGRPGDLRALVQDIKTSRETFDVVVLHGALAYDATLPFLEPAPDSHEARLLRAKVVFWQQVPDMPLVDETLAGDVSARAVHFTGIISPVPGAEAHIFPSLRAKVEPQVALIPYPVPPEIFTFGEQRDYDRGQTYRFKALHVAYQTPPAQLRVLTERLAAMSHVDFAVLAPEEIGTLDDLCARIQAADLIIEQLDGECYGIVGAMALALARPVFSQNTPEWRRNWPAMEMCPVVHVSAESLAKRLQAFLLEPRTLRDLGKRGRAFANAHHHPKKGATLTEAFYQQLLR